MNTEPINKSDVAAVLETKPQWRTVLVLFVVSLVLYFINWVLFPEITPDGFLYLELAKNIPESGYTELGKPHTKFLPFYPALMAFGNLLTFDTLGEDVWGHLISMTSGALLPPLFFLMALKMGATRRSALTLAIIQIIMYVGLHQYRDINVMPLFTALLALCLYKILVKKYVMAGIIAGLAATTRYEIYLFIPVFLCGYSIFKAALLIELKKNGSYNNIKEEIKKEVYDCAKVFSKAGIGFVLGASF
jgi:4-amino-4-deoxy-L-arabinose transferase-like glycosyltransferase